MYGASDRTNPVHTASPGKMKLTQSSQNSLTVFSIPDPSNKACAPIRSKVRAKAEVSRFQQEIHHDEWLNTAAHHNLFNFYYFVAATM